MAYAGLSADRLTRAGAELADEAGFGNVTVSALARHFDVKVASLYSHVRDAADLRRRIALLALEELADRASDAVAGRSGKDALTALADAYRDYAHEHPGRWEASQLRLDPETAEASAGRRHSAMMWAVLRGYDIEEPDRSHAVRLLGSVIYGYVGLERAGGFDHSNPGTQQSWERILDILDTTLHAWPREKS
jgi:AcrR family transcriptional regulator